MDTVPCTTVYPKIMTQATIIIFNDTHGWHSAQLEAALTRAGFAVIKADLAECVIDLSHSYGLHIPGMGNTLPAAVFVRGIAPGSLEQITLRMDVLHTLAELAVPVFNSAQAIEHTVDKARTSLRLHLAGIATPQTWACENRAAAMRIAKQQFSQGKSLVVKPLFGCQGKGIKKVASLQQLAQIPITGEVFYLQEYIEPFSTHHCQDWRLMVIDNQVCAAMSRQSQHWITNFAQGAHCFAAALNPEMTQLAIQATQAVGAAYAGVDLIRRQDGRYTVLEVNSVPAWKGLQQATGLDIADFLSQALIKRISTSHHATGRHVQQKQT